MNTQMNPGGLTDDELLRLARLLQQTRGEGLAFINPGEAEMLKDAGGSGQPIPGTKGFGVGGGPIRSYEDADGQPDEGEEESTTTDEEIKELIETTGYEFETDTGGGSGGSGLKKVMPPNNPPSASIIHLYKRDSESGNWILKPQSTGPEFDTNTYKTTPPEGWTQTGTNITKNIGNSLVTGVPDGKGGYTFISSGGENTSGTNLSTVEQTVLSQQGTGGDSGQQQQVYTPPPKFYDSLGNEHATQEDADAANAEISQQQTNLSDFLKSQIKVDSDLKTFLLSPVPPEIHKLKDKQGNPINLTYKDYFSSVYGRLPESEIERIFNDQRTLTLKNAGPQTKKFTDTITQVLQNSTVIDEDGTVTSIPRTQEELESLTFDDVAAELTGYLSEGEVDLLSENTKRTIFQTMLNNAVRTERFSLTPEEVAEFARSAIQVDTTGISDATTPQITAPTEATAPKVGTVDAITAPTIKTVDEAEAVDVDEVTAPDRTIIEDVGNLNQEFLEEVRKGENELAEVLKKRISGEARSPAEQQLRQATENNLRTLLSTTAGVIDPAKLRQVRNLYSETAQQLSGQAAELRSREQIDAEDRLVNLYAQQGTRELQIAMADLENDRQIAVAQGQLDQARKLAVLEADLQRVITKATLKQNAEIANLRERAETARAQGNLDLQAEINDAINQRERVIAQLDADTRVEIENLSTAKDVAIAQGRIDVAIAIANLEKDVTLATTNADLALRSRALDDALALANYEGEMALEGIETKVELTELELDVKTKLAELGYETQEKIANLNAETQVLIANLNKQAARYAQDSAERAGIIDFIGTVIAMAIA